MRVEQHYKGIAAMDSLMRSARKRKLTVGLRHEPARRPDVTPAEPQGDIVLLVGHRPVTEGPMIVLSINRTDLADAAQEAQRTLEELIP